jgi:SAM-dependent methyltransferase
MPPAERLRRARSFGAVAGEYERGRPGYPPEAIAWILGEEPLDTLDVGAGTGKLSAAVLAAGHRVVAVEPLAEMREALTSAVPGARVIAGSAEQLPLDAASVDAVVVGAAFHWFDAERALAEIVRVLRPPGTLALLGNSFDTTVPWQAELRKILGPATLGRPGHWPDPDRLLADFEYAEEREFRHSQPIDLPRLRDYASSRSSFAVLPAAEREQRLAAVDALWNRTPDLAPDRTPELRWITRARRCRVLRQPRPRGSG